MPAWARGKTAAEVLQTSKQMYEVLERFNQQGAVQPPAQSYQPPPAQYQQYQQPTGEIGDDEFLTGRQVKQYGQQLQQQIAPQFQEVMNIAARTAYEVAQTKYQKEFEKWGPEIQALVSNMPPQSRTLDNIGTVVDVVRGRHYRELVDEGIRQRAAEQVPSLRPNGGATEPGTPTSGFAPDIDPQWKDRAKAAGIDEATVREFCAANHMTEKAFYEQFKNGLVTSAVAESRPRTVIR